MKTFLFGHTHQDTAYVVDDYPYGYKLRTQIRYWIESVPKKGDRFCSQTINPKTGKWNAVKKSTFYVIGVMYLDEKGHTQWTCIGPYSSDKAEAFVQSIGGVEKLNDLQRIQYNDMLGIREEKETINEYGNTVKTKNFAVKWYANHIDITFDRIDGVALQEVFEAISTLNQSKVAGMQHVNINTRGGMRLGSIDVSQYNDWLANDENAELRETLNKGKKVSKIELFEPTKEGAEAFVEKMQENIKEPYVSGKFGGMGDFATIYLTIALTPKESWAYGYLNNAPTLKFYIHSNGVIEFKGYPYSMREKPRFRKQSAKNTADVLSKINNYLESLKPYDLK